MQPELRQVIVRSKFHRKAIEAVAALLPVEDGELDALIGETVEARDAFGFIFVMLAALGAGRPVDARHLAGGTMLFSNWHVLGWVAWHVQGELPEQLMQAVKGSRLGWDIEAVALVVTAVWCMERRNGVLPAELIPAARMLARNPHAAKKAGPYLRVLASLVKDAGLTAIVEEQHGKVAIPEVKRLCETVVQICRGPLAALVPEAPDHELARGATMRRSVARIGRNEPCPCGSGKKYKHCCIAKDEERLHFSTDVAGKTVDEVLAEPEPHLTLPKLMRASPHEAIGWDPRKLKPELREEYFIKLAAFSLFDAAVAGFEKLECDEELHRAWHFVLFWVAKSGRRDLVERLLKLRTAVGADKDVLEVEVRLILVDDDPGAQIRILEECALAALQTENMDKVARFACGLLDSKFRALGVFAARSAIPLVSEKYASTLFNSLLEARDRLNLSPEDPFGEIMDERFRAKEDGEGKEAEALRAAQHRLDEKAGEVRVLKEGLARLHEELKVREQSPAAGTTPSAPVAPTTAGETALQELRRKVEGLKAALKERHLERNELRRELQKAQENLETLRSTAAPPGGGPAEVSHATDTEAELLLPPEPPTPQPVRLIEFPKDFHAGLNSLPRAVARGTLTMLGRLAAGEAAAFVGMVRLKACHGIFRQRIGSDFRLLFRLLPDRVQVVDLIPRQDLLRRIKTLV